ncbi:MAG TPA: response regulator [Lacipirellulaceae bacterium]
MSHNLIQVLLVDDDATDAGLTTRALAKIGHSRFTTQRAGSLAEAAEKVRGVKFDVALLDLGLPDSPRNETLARFRASCSADLPVIVLTGLADEKSALEALGCGAQDYITKDDVTSDLLSRTISYALQRQHLLEQLKASNDLLAQKNARLAELYETAQQFVENVSHEFRTPLTVIREFTSIIQDGLDGPVTPKQFEHLGKVLHRTDDLALMVDDMLDISKLEAGLLGVWRRPCNIGETLDAVRALLKSRADSKQIQLSVSLPEALPDVFCDEEKARRVLTNLTVNALKFTPDGGTVKLWAKIGKGEAEVIVGVTDTGPGISPENLAIIFERFQQVDQGLKSSTKGFGLGLNIAKELVALNLGRIDVASTIAAGSTFSFTLPINDIPSVFERYLDRMSAAPRAGETVGLFTASADSSLDASVRPLVDEFLQRSVRAYDLVMQRDTRTWVVATACHEQDSDDLIRRLLSEWQAFVRNCPHAELPQLELRQHGANHLASQRPELTSAFAALMKPDRDQPCACRRILVVDDDGEVSHCLGIRLRAAGYEVISAMDGEAGLSAALLQHPDAVVLDVRMPKKDGLTVLRELRRHEFTKDVPIVMLSASISDQHRALEAGANFFVPKPYEAKDVLSAIETSMREEVLL